MEPADEQLGSEWLYQAYPYDVVPSVAHAAAMPRRQELLGVGPSSHGLGVLEAVPEETPSQLASGQSSKYPSSMGSFPALAALLAPEPGASAAGGGDCSGAQAPSRFGSRFAAAPTPEAQPCLSPGVEQGQYAAQPSEPTPRYMLQQLQRELQCRAPSSTSDSSDFSLQPKPGEEADWGQPPATPASGCCTKPTAAWGGQQQRHSSLCVQQQPRLWPEEQRGEAPTWGADDPSAWQQSAFERCTSSAPADVPSPLRHDDAAWGGAGVVGADSPPTARRASAARAMGPARAEAEAWRGRPVPRAALAPIAQRLIAELLPRLEGAGPVPASSGLLGDVGGSSCAVLPAVSLAACSGIQPDVAADAAAGLGGLSHALLLQRRRHGSLLWRALRALHGLQADVDTLLEGSEQHRLQAASSPLAPTSSTGGAALLAAEQRLAAQVQRLGTREAAGLEQECQQLLPAAPRPGQPQLQPWREGANPDTAVQQQMEPPGNECGDAVGARPVAAGVSAFAHMAGISAAPTAGPATGQHPWRSPGTVGPSSCASSERCSDSDGLSKASSAAEGDANAFDAAGADKPGGAATAGSADFEAMLLAAEATSRAAAGQPVRYFSQEDRWWEADEGDAPPNLGHDSVSVLVGRGLERRGLAELGPGAAVSAASLPFIPTDAAQAVEGSCSADVAASGGETAAAAPSEVTAAAQEQHTQVGETPALVGSEQTPCTTAAEADIPPTQGPGAPGAGDTNTSAAPGQPAGPGLLLSAAVDCAPRSTTGSRRPSDAGSELPRGAGSRRPSSTLGASPELQLGRSGSIGEAWGLPLSRGTSGSATGPAVVPQRSAPAEGDEVVDGGSGMDKIGSVGPSSCSASDCGDPETSGQAPQGFQAQEAASCGEPVVQLQVAGDAPAALPTANGLHERGGGDQQAATQAAQPSQRENASGAFDDFEAALLQAEVAGRAKGQQAEAQRWWEQEEGVAEQQHEQQRAVGKEGQAQMASLMLPPGPVVRPEAQLAGGSEQQLLTLQCSVSSDTAEPGEGCQSRANSADVTMQPAASRILRKEPRPCRAADADPPSPTTHVPRPRCFSSTRCYAAANRRSAARYEGNEQRRQRRHRQLAWRRQR